MENKKSPRLSPSSITLRSQYINLNHIGCGAFGNVFKCSDRLLDRCVAIKRFTCKKKLNEELKMLTFLMENNLHEKNIIRFIEADLDGLYLVLELCDISLSDYIKQLNTPMRLQDIRLVIQQLATAFDALKKVGVIHADLKANNIMLVDQTREPLQVKLIDFGLSLFTKDAKYIRTNQVIHYKAPELILGLPYSEALDIWSLGCVMSKMVFNCRLFPARDERELLYYINSLLGPPPNHLLNAGRKSKKFFFKNDNNQWLLKNPQKFFIDNRTYSFHTLDDAKTKLDNSNEARERTECIELLKKMLNWNANSRITPRKILAHPFITTDYSRSSSSSLKCISMVDSEPCSSKALYLPKTKPLPRTCWGSVKSSDSVICKNTRTTLSVPYFGQVAKLQNVENGSSCSSERKPKKKNCLMRMCCCCFLNGDGESFMSSDQDQD